MYAHISDLEGWDPETASIAKILLEKLDVKIGAYIYHLTKAGYVDRIHESDSRDGQSYIEPEQEKSSIKHFRFQHPNQNRLPNTGIRGKQT